MQAERNIIVAVDDTESAKRAVLYVAGLLGGIGGIRVMLMEVVPEPSETLFQSAQERESWTKSRYEEAGKRLALYREVLIQSGFGGEYVETKTLTGPCPSVADCIRGEAERISACTVVIGRRGITKKEEFLRGSTSSRMLHTVKNCALWVVE